MKWFVSILVIGIISSTLYAIITYPSNDLRIIVCNVGQGDSILIQRSFLQVIVDSGQGSGMLECLAKYKPFWDQTIEMLILTHPQIDHYGSMSELLHRYEIERFLANGYSNQSKSFNDLLQDLAVEEVELIQPHQGQIYLLDGDVRLEFIWPQQPIGDLPTMVYGSRSKIPLPEVEDPNQDSLVFYVTYGSFDALFTGDIGYYQELALGSQRLLRAAEFLKVPHHGSKHSSSLGFLQTLSPQVSVISVGENNQFGHPHPDVISRLKSVNTHIYRTDQDGDVVISTDGSNLVTP